MNIAEVIVFVIYLCFMLGVGIYFFLTRISTVFLDLYCGR